MAALATAAAAAAAATTTAAGNTTAVVAAFNAGQLGFSFSIAGFLVTYLAGVAYKLVELGVITRATPIAGASSGALLATALCSGLDAPAFKRTIRRLSAECRGRYNCQMALDDAVRRELDRSLPRDAHRRCSGAAWLSVSAGDFPPRPGRARNELAGQFRSRDDLLDAAAASSYIPMWSGKALHTRFRGADAYDGFFTNQQPCPPAAAAAAVSTATGSGGSSGSSSGSSSKAAAAPAYCVRVNSRWPPWGAEGLNAFFGILGRVARLGTGKPPLLARAPAGGFAPAALRPDAAAADAMWRRALALGVDLAPDVFSATGIPLREWEALLVLPGDDAIIDHTWALGEVDAVAWARSTGLLDAVAAKRGGGGASVGGGGGGGPSSSPATGTGTSSSSSSKGGSALLSGSKAAAGGASSGEGAAGSAPPIKAPPPPLPLIAISKGGKGVFGGGGGGGAPGSAVQTEAAAYVVQG